MTEHRKEIEERAESAAIPSDLGRLVRKQFRVNPVLSWNQALMQIMEPIGRE
jgi:hypothetical protein